MLYSEVAELVTIFGQYKTEHPKGEMADFGRWLTAQRGSLSQTDGDFPVSDTKDFAEYIRERTPSQQLGILIGRLYRFARFYSKKNLAHLELSLEEFGFLAGTKQLGNPTKSELITMNLSEPTSGTEILKRLLKLGYIAESDNLEDKRSKRISVTDLGNATLNKAYQHMGDMAFFMAGNLSNEEVEQLVRSLRYLNDFHTYHYNHHKDMGMDELINEFIEK